VPLVTGIGGCARNLRAAPSLKRRRAPCGRSGRASAWLWPKWLQALLFGVSPAVPLTYLATAGVLAA